VTSLPTGQREPCDPSSIPGTLANIRSSLQTSSSGRNVRSAVMSTPRQILTASPGPKPPSSGSVSRSGSFDGCTSGRPTPGCSSSPSASPNIFAAMSQCPRTPNLSDQPYNPAIIFWDVRINRPVTWLWKIAALRYVIGIGHGDASDKFCPYFADQLFGAYLRSVLGLATEIAVAQSTYLMKNKSLMRLR
jgi:hypothetical protein